MKKFVFFALFILKFAHVEAQSVISDEQVEAGLKAFFTRLQFDFRSSQDPSITQQDLDKLEKKYCSYTLLKRYRNGDDPFIKILEGFDITTMKIKKDNKDPNCFLLSYISAYERRAPRIIHVNVLKQGSNFKIESVW